LGKTTMRVSAKYNSDPNPCETGFDGEVEDYTLFIKEPLSVDFEVVETDICQGETIHFEYTGTAVDDLSWTFTNGVDTYTSTALVDSLVLENPGSYNLTLVGWEGELTDGGTWTGIVNVHPTYNEAVDTAICEGESIEFGALTLTEAGEYTEPFETVYGCDSTVTMTLSLLEVNVGVTAEDYELTADEVGADYQWLDCNDGWSVIEGATSQTFVPSDNGSYAVIVNDGTCIDTSDCYDIVALTIAEYGLNGVRVYPNPAHGTFNIQTAEMQPTLDVKVYDLAGKMVFDQVYSNAMQVSVDLSVATGIYYVHLLGIDNEKIIVKLAVE